MNKEEKEIASAQPDNRLTDPNQQQRTDNQQLALSASSDQQTQQTFSPPVEAKRRSRSFGVERSGDPAIGALFNSRSEE